MANVRRLYLFKESNPNREGGHHIIAADEKGYLNAAGTRLCIVSEDNYRVNSLVAKVEGNVLESTYAIDVEYDTYNNEFLYWRCYHVKSADYVSGFTVLYLSVDLWGSYLFKAKITNGTVTRCNRNIGLGKYDPINETAYIKGDADILTNIVPLGGDSKSSDGTVSWYDCENVSIVFFASCVISETISGSNNVTEILPFAAKLSDLATLFDLTSQSEKALQSNGIAEAATQLVSGITSLKTSVSWLKTNDVTILRMYFVPTELLNFGSWFYTFNTKCQILQDAGLSDVTLGGVILKPSNLRLAFEFNPTGDMLNFKYFAGTHVNGMELTAYTQPSVIEYSFTLNHDGLQALVMQGDDVKDISSHFQLQLLGSSEQNDALKNIAYWGKYLTNLIGAVGKNFSTNSAYKQIGATTSYVSGVFSQLGQSAKAGGTVGNGDGSVTFDWSRKTGSPLLVNYPFYLIKYKSVRDERQNARYNGASFNVHLSDGIAYDVLSHIAENNYLLGEGSLTDTFIEMNCCVTGVPSEACTFIESELRKGIYYS